MASIKQIEANRLNSRKSTGPRSAEGKAAASMNALKTGIHAASHIIRGEDAAELEQLTAEYYQRFSPATPEERAFVDLLVRGEWQMRRHNKIEAQLWEYRMGDLMRLDEDSPLGHAFHIEARFFGFLQRRIDSTERSFRNALHELERLQAVRAAAQPQPAPPPQPDPEPAPPPQPEDSKTASPQIGFVPSTQPATPALVVVAPPRSEHGLPSRVPQANSSGSAVIFGGRTK